ncbi:hypothetical protein BaRGS_00029000 [Batillaria attramentaria]|uniref:Uncharacterized protein n=1 Tax=Batillaria attramentaria TaxID=370345 RepID=A0ABD0JY96_9CAEN
MNTQTPSKLDMDKLSSTHVVTIATMSFKLLCRKYQRPKVHSRRTSTSSIANRSTSSLDNEWHCVHGGSVKPSHFRLDVVAFPEKASDPTTNDYTSVSSANATIVSELRKCSLWDEDAQNTLRLSDASIPF